MKLTATYVWSFSVEVEVPDNATEDEQREALENMAILNAVDGGRLILHECSNENLIEIGRASCRERG